MTYSNDRIVNAEIKTRQVMSDVWDSELFVVFIDDAGEAHGEWNSQCDAKAEASAELKAAYIKLIERRNKADAVLGYARENLRIAEQSVLAIKKGDTVVVARGRKVPKGTTGVLIWIGEGTWGERAGVKDAAGVAHWTALKNCDLADPTKIAVQKQKVVEFKAALVKAEADHKAAHAARIDLALLTDEVVLGLA